MDAITYLPPLNTKTVKSGEKEWSDKSLMIWLLIRWSRIQVIKFKTVLHFFASYSYNYAQNSTCFLGRSSIWTCRISNICFCFFICAFTKKTTINVINSTESNRWVTMGISKGEKIQKISKISVFPLHGGAFCQFPFYWIYYYGSYESTGKENG